MLAAGAALSLPAGATTFFTGSSSNPFVFFAWNLSTGNLGFVYEYYDADTACSACLAVTSASGAALGNASLGIGGNYYFSNVGNGQPATLVATNVYLEKLVPFNGPSGSLAMSFASGATLLNSAVTGYSVYATPGQSTPVIEFDLSNSSSTVLGALPSTLYLDITGTTTAPVGLTSFSGNPSGQSINGFTLDWTATLTDVAYSPTAQTPPPVSSVPEPSSPVLLLAGLGAIAGAVARRRA